MNAPGSPNPAPASAALVRRSPPASQASGRAAMDGYTLDTPTSVATLPAILDEVSGLTDVSATEVAMVQDEQGVVFVYDLVSHRITAQIPFGPPGDYEGLTRIGGDMLVLRSDGTLYQVSNWRSSANVRMLSLELPTSDNEGLAFDAIEQRVLIAPKSRWQRGKSSKNLRPVFSFDRGTGRLDGQPYRVLDVESLIDFARRTDRKVPTKETKKGRELPALRFMPASVAVHPKTHELFVISAVDRVLASFDGRGRATGYHQLGAALLPQAEGITFLDDATLIITTEAVGARSRLARFRWNGGAS